MTFCLAAATAAIHLSEGLPWSDNGSLAHSFPPGEEVERAEEASRPATLTISGRIGSIVFPALTRRVLSRLVRDVKAEEVGSEVEGPSPQPRDLVGCSVFAPPLLQPTESFVVQVFVHPLQRRRRIEELAAERDTRAVLRGVRTMERAVPRGARLEFELRLEGLLVDGPVQSCVWAGRAVPVQFPVKVPPSAKRGTVFGMVSIRQDGIPVGWIKVTLRICSASELPDFRRSNRIGEIIRQYHRAFISYASADRSKVLDRIQVLQAVGIDCFQDLLSLRPGDRWAERIFEAIDSCDLFILCWSQAASESKWVRKETLYALTRKANDDDAPPDIRPIIIGALPIPEPWPEISHLHFNDHLAYVRAAIEAQSFGGR